MRGCHYEIGSFITSLGFSRLSVRGPWCFHPIVDQEVPVQEPGYCPGGKVVSTFCLALLITSWSQLAAETSVCSCGTVPSKAADAGFTERIHVFPVLAFAGSCVLLAPAVLLSHLSCTATTRCDYLGCWSDPPIWLDEEGVLCSYQLPFLCGWGRPPSAPHSLASLCTSG